MTVQTGVKQAVPEITFEQPTSKGALVATPAAARPARRSKQPADLLQLIADAARDPRVDIDKMERLIRMQKDMQATTAEIEFDNAMAAAQEEMEPIRADLKNKQTDSRYASLHALDRAIRPLYTKHGFSLTFTAAEGAPADHVRIVCRVAHRGGHRERPYIDMPADGKGAKGADVMTKTHATGSAATYGRRYLKQMIFDLAIDRDDDGNAAGGYRGGAAGTAGGGGEFRPARRGAYQGRSWTDDDPHLVDSNRTKGHMPGPSNAPRQQQSDAQPAAANDLRQWCLDAPVTFPSIHTKADLIAWWQTNRDTREEAAEKEPAAFDQMIIAYDARMTALNARGN